MSICHGVAAIQARYVRAAGVHSHELDAAGLLAEMLARIDLNWELSPRLLEGKRPSAENWRLERRPHIAARNTSPEKTLEKVIARDEPWYNQVPTASGLYDHRSDKLRNLDLVRRLSETSYACIELKVGSNTPLEAALELLTYAALYLIARRRYSETELQTKPLLRADRIEWRVLAPRVYFGPGLDYGRLAGRLSTGLEQQTRAAGLNCAMDFAFLSFPQTFVWPCPDADLQQALGALDRVD